MGFKLTPVLVLIISVSPYCSFVIENSTDLVNGRIIGGEDSLPNSAPYIVGLFLKGRQKDKQYCAGSIITERWIVTGAHCLKEPSYRIIVIAGLNFANISDTSKSQLRRTDFYVKHENYSSIFGATGGFDIGLIRITKPFQFTEFIQPIGILESSDNLQGLVAIFGWGRTSLDVHQEFPIALQTATLAIVDRKNCEAMHNTTIGQGTVCAGGVNHNKGGCVGDSGGPLVQNNILVGIISWGPISCDPKQAPTVFTDIGYYISWIKEKTRHNSSE